MDRKKDLASHYKKAYKILDKNDITLQQKFEDLLELRKEILVERDKYLGKLLDNLFYGFLFFLILIFFFFLKTWWGLVISIICAIFVFSFLFKAKRQRNPLFEYNIKLKAIEAILQEIYKKILEKS